MFNTLICSNCVHHDLDEEGNYTGSCHWIRESNRNIVDVNNWCDNKETLEYDLPDYFEYFIND